MILQIQIDNPKQFNTICLILSKYFTPSVNTDNIKLITVIDLFGINPAFSSYIPILPNSTVCTFKEFKESYFKYLNTPIK